MLLAMISSMYLWSWGWFVCSFLRPPPVFRILFVFSMWSGLSLLLLCCCCRSFLPCVMVFGAMPVIWWTMVAPPYP